MERDFKLNIEDLQKKYIEVTTQYDDLKKKHLQISDRQTDFSKKKNGKKPESSKRK